MVTQHYQTTNNDRMMQYLFYNILFSLKSLLYLVRRYAGFDEVQDLFYSRKNYKRPELQQEPHRTFADEATLLDSMFHGNF